jgi:hypothetical protein
MEVFSSLKKLSAVAFGVERNAKAGPPNTSFLAAPDRLIFRLMAALYPTQNTPDTS